MRSANYFHEVNILICRQSRWTKDVSEFHNQFIDRMLKIPGPLGFEGAICEPAPEFGFASDGEPYSVAAYNVKGRTRGVKFVGEYHIPDTYGRTGPEQSAKTYYGHDSLTYRWKLTNKKIDYRFALHENLPAVIVAFGGRFTKVDPCYYDQAYCAGQHADHEWQIDADGFRAMINPVYNRLQADPAIDVDGWNNIYTLYPAQYWEGGRCLRALGYDRDEVIRRLTGKVPLVRPLLDGVYIVLNDNPDITYDEYYAMNVENKALLELQ